MILAVDRSMPPNLHQKQAQVIRRPGGLEHLIFLGCKRGGVIVVP
jgi:hypothetical protein